MSINHTQIYDQARCYDVAFSFRDVAAECDTLAALVQRHGVEPLGRVLELAAGPASHAREFARRGVRATALDASPAMCDYALAQARLQDLALDVACADMRDFSLPGSVDLALLLMDSACYLLDNDSVLRHLHCVARHLGPGGLYVLEMAHPRDAFRLGSSTEAGWTSECDGLRVDTTWGMPGDVFDPIQQVDAVTVHMAWSGPEGNGEMTETAHQRRFTANEFDALVRANGEFEVVQYLGSLAHPVPFDNSEAAWRMVPVLRRRSP